MRNAAKILILAFGVVALGACHKHAQANASANDDLSLEDNMSATQVPSNTDIETLPPDESDTASNGELNKGNDNPDVNDLSNND